MGESIAKSFSPIFNGTGGGHMRKVLLIILIILVIIIFVATIAVFAANRLFNKKVEEEILEFFGDSYIVNEIIVENDLSDLPKPVRKWLEYSGVVGYEKINTVHLKQTATMRLNPEQKWLPVEADEYFTVSQPGFIWKAYIKAAPFFHIVGRDKYFNGNGYMLIKLLSLISVADAKGPEINQGALLRFLGETVWFPPAALSDYIEWEEIDGNSAEATMKCGDVTASGVFTFNDKGEVINFTADRYYEHDGQYTLRPWSIDMNDYRALDGIKIPTRGEVTWKLETGDFTWFRFEITEIDYNFN